jgi:hypothetical protein
MSVINRPVQQLLAMELLKCLELYTKMRSYFTIFVLHAHIFIKIRADSRSPSKTGSIDMSFVYF